MNDECGMMKYELGALARLRGEVSMSVLSRGEVRVK
jgi:hypothetical protein